MTSSNGGRFVLGSDGGLAGTDGDGVLSIAARDFEDLPLSTLDDADILISFSVGAASIVGPSDSLIMRYLATDGTTPFVERYGNWVPVPEPNAGTLAIACVSVVMYRLKRGKQRNRPTSR